MAQYDSDYFKKKFEGLPPKATAVIALRAAMRVFPVLAQRSPATDAAFWFWPVEDRARYTHVTCRCFQFSAFTNSSAKAVLRFHAAPLRSDATQAASIAAAVASTAADFAAATRVTDAAFAAAAARAAAFADAARAAAFTPDAHTADAAARAAAFAAAAARAAAFADAAILTGITQFQEPSWFARRLGQAGVETDPLFLLAQPLWPRDMPTEAARLWGQLQRDLLGLRAGFEVWIDWYQDRLDGRSFDWEIERQWALLSKEQLSQSTAETNAYLKELRRGVLTKELKRVRAIFIGPGEAGNRLGDGERLGDLLRRQMRGERAQRVRARPLIANRLGSGECLGDLLRRQMRGERGQRSRAIPSLSIVLAAASPSTICFGDRCAARAVSN